MGREKIDYTIKEEYDLSIITDEYLYILQEKNNGKDFKDIALELGQSWVNVRTKAKSAIDILQGKKPSNKFCLNCGKELEDTSHAIKYCDDCKNKKIYISGHKNEEYGELKVDAVYRYKGYLYAECTCSCGKKRELSYSLLKNGMTISCGHIKAKDLTGTVNKNGIKALYQTGEKKRECYIWRCLCTCGKEFDVISTHFPNVKSCGHLFEESRKKGMMRAKEENEKYSFDGTNAIVLTSKIGKNNTSGYKGVKWVKSEQRWYAEITFKGKLYYLGRYCNIEDAAEVRKIAEEHTHKDFLRWFSEEYPLLYKKISDRVDINEMENITRMREIRERNRKQKVWILEYKGERKTLAEWCEELNMNYHCIRQRINAGWSVEKAFETPVRQREGQSNKEKTE